MTAPSACMLYECAFVCLCMCVCVCAGTRLESKIRSGCLQSIPRESNDKDVAAMLEELTIEAKEESFVIFLQHGGNDVTCKRCISA